MENEEEKTEEICKWCHYGKYDPYEDTITCIMTGDIVEEDEFCGDWEDWEDYTL